MKNNTSKKLNFIFWGTPDVASKTLDILKENGFVPSLIVTAPDAKSGRGLHMQSSPVAIFAEQNNISCLKPEKLDEKFSNKLKPISYKLSIVVAYGKIIPKEILNIPKLGSINIHYSLLPKYRGASPVESAILNGETETGVSIQKMVYKMDAGPIIREGKTNILPDEKAFDLRKRLIQIGGNLLIDILDTPSAKGHSPFAGGEEQDEAKATFCKKIKKEDGLVDLEAELPNVLYNKFRAYAQWPRTFFFKNNKRIIITNAVLENDEFVIKKVLPEGKKEIDYKDFNLRHGVD